MRRRVTTNVVRTSWQHSALPWSVRAKTISRSGGYGCVQMLYAATTLPAYCAVRRTIASSSSSPDVSAASGVAGSGTSEQVNGGGVTAHAQASSPLQDMPPPPRPAHYVPPAERPITDPSLDFIPADTDLARRHVSAQAGRFLAALRETDGQGMADGSTTSLSNDAERAVTMDGPPMRSPQLRPRCTPTPIYLDEDAARVQSTSLYAGQSLLRTRYNGADGGDFTAPVKPPAATQDEKAAADEEAVLRAVPWPTRQDAHATAPTSDTTSSTSSVKGMSFRQRSNMRSSAPPTSVTSFSQSSFTPTESHTNMDELTLDMKKLEYYQGTPRYAELLRDFQAKYDLLDPQPQLASETASATDKLGSNARSTGARVATIGHAATADAEPVDFAHLSGGAKMQLMSGMSGYHPQTLLAMYGKHKFQDYAFPATLELGQLNKIALAAGQKPTLWQTVRHRTAALLGRPHGYNAAESYLVTDTEAAKEDTHILYRLFGLDAVQRRQMRYVLADFDHADRRTALHVLLSYPYADWIHTFLVVFIGWLLYELQVHFNAYDFYDEYMGLDLRQTPKLKTPCLIVIAALVVGCVLFQPILLASIATNRCYRIAMRRPIGPP